MRYMNGFSFSFVIHRPAVPKEQRAGLNKYRAHAGRQRSVTLRPSVQISPSSRILRISRIMALRSALM